MDKTFFKKFLNARNEIAFETNEYFIRRPSNTKRRIALEFFKTFPASNIAYHISLIGEPNLFFIDIENKDISSLHRLLNIIKSEANPEPIIKLSGNRGVHLIWKVDDEITLKDMQKEAIRLKELSKTEIDIAIYSNNHLIRGIYSVHLKTQQFSYIVDKNLNRKPYDDNLFFNTDNYPIYTITHRYTMKEKMNEKIGKNSEKIGPEKKDYNNHNNQNNNQNNNPKKDEFNCAYGIEMTGVKEGERHDAIFFLTTFLKNKGIPKDEIEKRIFAFNGRCDPPEKEETIKKQIEDILNHNYKTPSCEWIKNHGFCINDY